MLVDLILWESWKWQQLTRCYSTWPYEADSCSGYAVPTFTEEIYVLWRFSKSHYCDYNIPPPRKAIFFLEDGCSNFSEVSLELYKPTRFQSRSTMSFFMFDLITCCQSFIWPIYLFQTVLFLYVSTYNLLNFISKISDNL